MQPESSKNWVQKMLRMKKVKMLIFDTPPIKNQCFWVPMEAKMEPKWSLKSILIAIRHDDWKMMLYREALGRAGASWGKGPWVRTRRGASTKCKLLKDRREGCSELRSPVPGSPYIGNLGRVRKAKHASHRAPGGTVADFFSAIECHLLNALPVPMSDQVAPKCYIYIYTHAKLTFLGVGKREVFG